MANYVHKVCYYETDKMGVVHHSNHIRWMEEARIEYFKSIGVDYRVFESEGIFSPVIAVECEYKSPVTFGDNVEIETSIEEYKGVRLTMKYTMINEKTRELVLTGRTRHCFVDRNGKLLIVKKSFPEADVLIRAAAES